MWVQVRTKALGCCSACGVLVEDAVQVSCTFYAELGLKADALVAASGGFSTIALLSLGAGLANAAFKMAEGCRRVRAGVLDDISPATSGVECATPLLLLCCHLVSMDVVPGHGLLMRW